MGRTGSEAEGVWPRAASHRLYRPAAEHICRRHDSLVTGARSLQPPWTRILWALSAPFICDLSVIVSAFPFFSRYILSLRPYYRLYSHCSLTLLLVLRLTAFICRVDTIRYTAINI
ncbi:hypothetical protein ACQKWADRAFT_221833 [Trichoderma austrokoningii]